MEIIDLTHLKIWVIDPQSCTDRDDAFSLCSENGNLILYIFIADVTSEFSYNTDFNNLTKNATTKYFIDNPPIHLFSKCIVDKYSLDIGIKKTVCIKIFLDNEFNILSEEILLATINITETFAYDDVIITNELKLAIKISDVLFDKRVGSGKVLQNYKLAYPIKINNIWILHLDNLNTNILKNMIAEFAILANQVVAKKINIKFNRICKTIKSTNDPQLFLQSIIQNNISASYELSDDKHLLIDNKVYTHFTSPLRRKSDCIVHFLLKGEIIPIEQLITSCEEINKITKIDKKRQHEEVKIYTIKAMSNMKKPIKIKLKSIGTYKQFTNMIIYSIEGFPVQISITLPTSSITETSNEYQTFIKEINLNGIHDSDIFKFI